MNILGSIREWLENIGEKHAYDGSVGEYGIGERNPGEYFKRTMEKS